MLISFEVCFSIFARNVRTLLTCDLAAASVIIQYVVTSKGFLFRKQKIGFSFDHEQKSTLLLCVGWVFGWGFYIKHMQFWHWLH